MRTDKVRPYLDRVGRVCGVKGCTALLHDEARFCARCGASTQFHGGWKAWWQGLFFPARCSRCRCMIVNAAHPFCRKCGKEDGANAYERESVPEALQYATISVGWMVFVGGAMLSPFVGVGAAVVIAAVVAIYIGL